MGRFRDAMERVVSSPNGTARHGRPAVLRMAVKTGTSGSRQDGFSGLVVGFVPLEAPRYAFAVYLPGAGRASGAAVRTTKILVDAIHRLEEERAPDEW